MSRQLKVENEPALIQRIVQNCQRVAERVYTYTDHARGIFSLVIRSEVVPPDWAGAAFQMNGRRHDYGYGEESHSIWIFPVAQAQQINRRFPQLISGLTPHQPNAAHASVRMQGHYGRPALN